MVAGVGLVVAIVAIFASTYATTGIGGASMSTDMATTSTQTNTILPYILGMMALGVVGAVFTKTRKN